MVDRGNSRVILRAINKLFATAVFLWVLWILAGFAFHTENADDRRETLKVSLRDIAAGEGEWLLWQGKPVVVFHRTDEMVEALRQPNSRLRDVDNGLDQLPPDTADALLRSRMPQWFVAVALGMDLNCSLIHVPASSALFKGVPWQGGFEDTCRKSRYDLAGRVYDDQESQRNLQVPLYRIDGDTLVLGGR